MISLIMVSLKTRIKLLHINKLILRHIYFKYFKVLQLKNMFDAIPKSKHFFIV